MPDDLRPLVLEACLDLMARDIYPSVSRIQGELRFYANYTYILECRRALIASGELPMEAKVATFRHAFRCRTPKGGPRGGLTGDTPAELAVIALTAAQIRAEQATRLPEDPRPVTGKLLLDQMGSPGLDRLTPAKVSAIVRRRCRGMFPTRPATPA